MLQGDKFCSACGSILKARQEAGRLRPVCSECGRVVYYDPKVAAVAVIERQGRVLMVRRANQPGYGLWSVPGGYVDRGEVVESAAVREVQEETGLLVAIEGFIGLFSEAGSPVIVAAFSAAETGGVLQAGPEALDVDFFDHNALPPLAFPRDALMLDRWHELGRTIR